MLPQVDPGDNYSFSPVFFRMKLYFLDAIASVRLHMSVGWSVHVLMI